MLTYNRISKWSTTTNLQSKGFNSLSTCIENDWDMIEWMELGFIRMCESLPNIVNIPITTFGNGCASYCVIGYWGVIDPCLKPLYLTISNEQFFLKCPKEPHSKQPLSNFLHFLTWYLLQVAHWGICLFFCLNPKLSPYPYLCLCAPKELPTGCATKLWLTCGQVTCCFVLIEEPLLPPL